ncbi:hypothetical protein K227x_05260 [Rubripirellula lacrimiformis]|uniref:Uncharacterized protein n=1 Tax=Rubripirellula lacrimiformis TaxID=1930273 RepID=A0A517N4U5_9BACT|nr:hypothetical protein [Rubripirellula lacrimiformis]QDT02155.1 hypothetical protein K227x_05260 [Rubripirellula lacrimiformis]
MPWGPNVFKRVALNKEMTSSGAAYACHVPKSVVDQRAASPHLMSC